MNLLAPYSWLREYVKTGIAPEEFARRLSEAGMGVERIHRRGEGLGKIVVATVADVRPHPNADKLRVAHVDAGKELIEVVCGGANLAAGMKVAFAHVGARVRWHGKGDPVALAPAEIRGVKSFGMICAADEIGLGDWFPHAEREILDLSWLDARNGTPIVEAMGLDDPIFDVEVTTNRPDALSMVGLAREASAILKAPFLWKGPTRPPLGKGGKGGVTPAALPFEVRVEDKALCPRYQAVLMDGVKMGPSPWRLRKRLLAAGIRPISNVVDITNYVMLETGQPLHAFDYDRLEGRKIVVRQATDGETIQALDGKEYALRKGMLVIADGKKPVAIAGVMGGEATGVTAKTARIVFESANFDPVSVRRTSRALALQSDSSLRFEKGLSTEGTAPALARAVALAEELAGASLAGKPADVRRGPYKPRVFPFDPAQAAALIGVAVPVAEMTRILAALGFSMKKKGKGMSVTVPWWRDHDIEDGRDFTEEIARITGYGTLPSVLPPGAPPLRAPDPELAVEERLKTLLADAGAFETYSYSLVPKELATLIGGPEPVAIANPLSAEYTHLRTSLIPSMLATVRENEGEGSAPAFFEVSRVYLRKEQKKGSASELPDEPLMALVACVGPSPAGEQYFAAKGFLDRIAAEWNVQFVLQLPSSTFQLPSGGAALWHPARAAEILVGGKPFGTIGEVRPELLERLGIERRVALLSFPVAALLAAARPRGYRPVSPFPPVKRDISFVIDGRRTYAEVAAAIAGASPLLTGQALFDVYQGKGVPEGKKSMAFHLTMSAPDRTLSAKEADEAFAALTKALERLGAQVRK